MSENTEDIKPQLDRDIYTPHPSLTGDERIFQLGVSAGLNQSGKTIKDLENDKAEILSALRYLYQEALNETDIIKALGIAEDVLGKYNK